MTKGMQNRDSKIALNHVLQSEGHFRKCNGIYHKGYPEGDAVPAEEFKRLGVDGYQAFCSTCDTARQNIQKTLKRLAAVLIVDPDFRIKLPKEFLLIENNLNESIVLAKKNATNPMSWYTNLVNGDHRLNVKNIGLYTTKLSVNEKKKVIELITHQIRDKKYDLKIIEYLFSNQTKWKFKCSTCKQVLLLSECRHNISQSRDVYTLKDEKTEFMLPLHNQCNACTKNNRNENLRPFRFLCDGDFFAANKEMSKIGKMANDRNVHADHIIPLRLGGKHDPINLRVLPGSENIFKKDKLTPEALGYLENHKIPIERVLSKKYWPLYEKYKRRPISVLEAGLRSMVDSEITRIKELTSEEKDKELKRLYPLLNLEERQRIIKKFFA